MSVLGEYISGREAFMGGAIYPGSAREGADQDNKSDKNEQADPLSDNRLGAFAPIEIDETEGDESDEMMTDPSANGVEDDFHQEVHQAVGFSGCHSRRFKSASNPKPVPGGGTTRGPSVLICAVKSSGS